MKKVFLYAILSIFFIIISAHANDQAGKILFTKSEFTREGFEEMLGRASVSKRGWWELHKRNICTINPDGTGFQQLTDDGLSYHARWSPDGRKLAFLSGPSSMVNLKVMNADGSEKVELIANQEDIFDFRWSPDGTKILIFLKTKMSRDPEETWVVSATNKNDVQRMGNKEWAKGWNHWAPNGATVVNPNKRLITGLPEGTQWPEWSPNGKYIAFVYNGRLAIADTSITGQPEPWKPTKTEPPCNSIGNWSWLPDNSRFLFFAGGNVCSINFDGSNLEDLSMASAGYACWSSDGSKVAYTSSDGRKRNTEIFIMNSDGTNHIQLTNTNYFHEDIDWK
jgi:Tol biopolymer transport system component